MELTRADIELLLESLEYTIRRLTEVQGTPYAVRQDTLKRHRAVQEKLRSMRDERAA